MPYQFDLRKTGAKQSKRIKLKNTFFKFTLLHTVFKKIKCETVSRCSVEHVTFFLCAQYRRNNFMQCSCAMEIFGTVCSILLYRS
jgi:hypothetical protein